MSRVMFRFSIKYIVMLLLLIQSANIVFSNVLSDYYKEFYEFDTWPGKNGSINGDLELPIAPLLGHGLQLRPVNHDTHLRFFLLPYPEQAPHFWQVQISIFPSINEAQEIVAASLKTFGLEKYYRQNNIYQTPHHRVKIQEMLILHLFPNQKF